MAETRSAFPGPAWWADLLALGCGAVLPLAFAPFQLFPLAVLAPALLFALWLSASPRRAFRQGYLFGLGLFGVGVSWVFVAIHDYGFTSAPVAALLTASFVAVLALVPALTGYASVRWLTGEPPSQGRVATALVIGLPAAWVFAEWVRGWLLTGFPWLNLGYSQIDAPLAGLAPVLGVYGVSWAVAVSAGLLVLLFTGRRRASLLAGVALVGLWGWALLLGQQEWTRPLGEPLKVSLVQGNVPQETKWDPDQMKAGMELYASLTRQHWDSDLIVWPENAITAFYHQVRDDFLLPLAEEARQSNTDIVLGLPVLEAETGRYFASMMTLGTTSGFYHKRHLVPFGEYVPLEGMLRGLIGFFDLPMSSFSRGPAQQPLLQGAGHPLATTICYEDAFGEEVIGALPEASLLLNGSNNAWYGDSLAPPQHLQIARMRALETGRDLVRATTNGISALVDHRGRLYAASPQFQTYVLEGTVQPRQGATPYVRLGNAPVVAGLVLALAVAGWTARPARTANQSPGIV